jgi:hypothetical protein
MIAILYTESEAVKFSEKIHNFIMQNRNNYNAPKWSDINKSGNNEKWCVKLPQDIDQYKEKIDLTGIELINKLPDNWRNTDEL